MKTRRIIASIITIFCTFIATAQGLITVNIATAGGFGTALATASGNKATVTNLTVTGNIDARDVKFMRDSMPELAALDLEAVQIKAYNGAGGTDYLNNSYPANQMPVSSFDLSSMNNTTLISIKLPNSITSIGNSAFHNCTALTGSLKIPNSVTSIGNAAFQWCTGLTGNLSIPNAVTSIGWSAFDGCEGFTGSLTLSSSLTMIDIMAFYGCIGLTGPLIIPSSLTTINGDDFKWCKGFASCYIPNSVTFIGPTALQGCSGMQKIVVNKVAPLLSYEFMNVDQTTCELIVPKGSKVDYQAASGWKDFSHITEAIFVTLNTRGGNPAAPITTTAADSIIAAPNNPIRDGYSFAGWYKEAACTNVWDFATDTVPAPVTLFAKWTANPANSFTVTFNANGGSLVLDITATSNTSITAPTAPTKTGYTFAGWYKEAACTNAWNFATDVVTANITLFAKWSATTSIGKQSIAGFKIYPNPATSTLQLSNLPLNAEIGVFSMDGKLVKQQNITTSESTIDIEDFPKGVYFLKVNNKEINMVQKFIKQ